MRTLKRIISRYMYQITLGLVAVILVIVLCLQIINERERAYENALETLSQIEQVLEENQTELVEIQEEYKQTSLHNAEAIARIIEGDPDVVDDLEELNKIAESMEVDEIHIFDETGRIVTGTHPEYYNYTFDSGEQMMFFKPMLEDKSLKLVQEITPNTAEGKLMQYSALWSENGEFIVQVGMQPVNVTKVTEKNKMSYIFSLFRVNVDAGYYAVDAQTGEIVGSTDLENIGCNLTEIGFRLEDIIDDGDGFYAKINGQNSFCVFKKIGTNYVGQVVSLSSLYQRVPAILLTLLVCLAVVSLVLVKAVTKHMNRYVVDEIYDINSKLNAISNGDLQGAVDVRSSVELSKLSDYINKMVKSLLDNNKKMSYVLSKTNLYIGIYEYNSHMDRVRFTEYIPQIFSLEPEAMERLASDIGSFKSFIYEQRQNPVPDEPGVYQVGEKYVKLEEILNNEDVFGVAIDVTVEIMKRRAIEMERDMDPLTGLYNRRGLEIKLSELFAQPEKLRHSAIIMVDADGLKKVNDTYGHETGDVYLVKIAEVINSIGNRSSIASRQGGDEFILFLYDYASEEELTATIDKLKYLQNHSCASIHGNQKFPLRFSYGYSLTREDEDYQTLLKEADEKMYENKLERRK